MKLHQQILLRRRQLGLRQKDMYLKVGMTQQQYQRIEAGANTRLGTVELITEGLESELMLIPKSKIPAVRALLSEKTISAPIKQSHRSVDEDPWEGMGV